MNDHNLDDLIIDTIQPNNGKAKSFLTIVALFIVVVIVGIVLAKSYNNNTKNPALTLDDNSSVAIAPELRLQEPEVKTTHQDTEESSLSKIIEEKVTEPVAPTEAIVPKEEVKPTVEDIPEVKTQPEQEEKHIEIPPVTETKETHTETHATVEKKPVTPKTEIKKPIKKPVATHYKPSATSSLKYYVQVGSFKQHPSPRFLSVIKSSGFHYHVSKPDAIGNKKLLIGPYKTRADVDKALAVVRDRIHKSAFVVQK